MVPQRKEVRPLLTTFLLSDLPTIVRPMPDGNLHDELLFLQQHMHDALEGADTKIFGIPGTAPVQAASLVLTLCLGNLQPSEHGDNHCCRLGGSSVSLWTWTSPFQVDLYSIGWPYSPVTAFIANPLVSRLLPAPLAGSCCRFDATKMHPTSYPECMKRIN